MEDPNRGSGRDEPAGKAAVGDARAPALVNGSGADAEPVFGNDLWLAAVAAVVVLLGLMQGVLLLAGQRRTTRAAARVRADAGPTRTAALARSAAALNEREPVRTRTLMDSLFGKRAVVAATIRRPVLPPFPFPITHHF